MGQHKYNPTAIAAKEGKLPPKSPRLTKAEKEKIVYDALFKAMNERLAAEQSAAETEETPV